MEEDDDEYDESGGEDATEEPRSIEALKRRVAEVGDAEEVDEDYDESDQDDDDEAGEDLVERYQREQREKELQEKKREQEQEQAEAKRKRRQLKLETLKEVAESERAYHDHLCIVEEVCVHRTAMYAVVFMCNRCTWSPSNKRMRPGSH